MAASTPTMRRMNRLDLSKRITGLVDDDVALVGGIGNAGFDLYSARHRPGNFYMLGSMGLAVPIGLGIALAQPERTVIVMEGEGSILMNLGGLATVGREAPPNLTIVVWDNAQWQLTGGQQTATGSTTDMAAVARACGISNASAPEDESAFEQGVRYAVDAPGPHVIVAHIDAEPAPGRHHDDPVFIKYEFMRALGIHPD
jgi:thiamine pyrophosphate-dependent acetolactate synthase large subunit-like protein